MIRLLGFLTLTPGLMIAPSGLAVAQSRVQISETSFSFEIFDPTQPVEHTFHFYNTGAETIQVERIALTPPLGTKKIISKIPPEQEGQLIVSLGTPRKLGEY